MYLELTPLEDVSRRFGELSLARPFREHVGEILRRCPQGGRTCEVSCGPGYASVWLSQHDLRAEGLAADGETVEQARQINDRLEGKVVFRELDPFALYRELDGLAAPAGADSPVEDDRDTPRYDVIHHQDFLHRFTVPEIRALLAQQVARAGHVVFSVPSVYQSRQHQPHERFLPLEEWVRILVPFRVLDLRYYGEECNGGHEYLLCVLAGQIADEELLSLMTPGEEPFPQGISAIVHTRNEERHIADCLKTLQGWTDEIIVCDMESSDHTVEIARQFTDNVFSHPRLANFDRARNVSAMRAQYRWIFYLDADERVPETLGAKLRDWVLSEPEDIVALATPFRTVFAGQWLQSLHHVYKAPPLYRNGRFFYNTPIHSGASVDGKTARLPPGNPNESILHFSYDSIDHCIDKFQGYSSTEALNLDTRGHEYHWKNAIRDFVREFQIYYDGFEGSRDGGHGLLFAFLNGFYRFAQHAKLYERHFCAGALQASEREVPAGLEEMLHYALEVARDKSPLPDGHHPTTLADTIALQEAHQRQRNASMARDGESRLKEENPDSTEGVSIRTPKISLCMIVRNEERVLDACLSSIEPWVDEMIVVDTGSDDATVEIAARHGAKVVHFPWTDSFSEARNISLDHATGDWIFWMDADDTIPEKCGKGLRQLTEAAEENTTGFLMQVHIPPAPGEEGFTVVDHVKLFRNLPGLRFEGRIHEQILESIYQHGGRVERSPYYVVHSGYDYSAEGQASKRERDWTLLNKDLEERPDHPFVLFNIGMTAYHTKDFDRALPSLERCLEVAKPQESIVRKVYAMLAGCHLEKGDIPRAVGAVEQGLELFSRDPELLFRGGIIYREAKDLPAAERCYRTLLEKRETGHIDSLDVSLTGFKAHHNLALIYFDMGDMRQAESQWTRAVEAHPCFAPSWLGLGDLYLRQARWKELDEVIVHLSPLSPGAAQALMRSRQSLYPKEDLHV